MKKSFTFIVLAALLLTTASNLSAQNRCMLKNSKGSQEFVTSYKNVKVLEQNDQCYSAVAYPEIKPQVKGNAQTHTLNVYPPTENEWDFIFISDGVDIIEFFFEGMGDYLSLDLEEGTYYIETSGYIETDENYFRCYWTFDVDLNEDTDVYVDFNECIYDLTINAVDENGNPFEGEYVDINYTIDLFWLEGLLDDEYNYWTFEYTNAVPRVRFNDVNEHSIIRLNVNVEPGNNKSYMIECQTRGMHESQVYTVVAEDMEVVQETFTVKSDAEICYYHTDYKNIISENGAWSTYNFWSINLVFDPKKPYTLVTNSKIGDPNNFETGSKTIFFPTIYEWRDLYGSTDYLDYISTTLYIDAEGNVVREAMPLFREDINPKPASWPVYFPETPAKTVMPSGKMTTFGERTPLATYYPRAFNADNTPLNQNFFSGGFYFSGEQSCERTSDYDSFIQIYVDGQEAYNDSIWKFNKYWVNNQPTTPGDVVVEVNNTHLNANEVSKFNKTRVEFSLRNDDAMPPTMTFLRVLDGNGDEAIWHDQLSTSTLVFGCADFGYHFNESTNSYDQLEYNANPDVELLFSLDGETWEPLAFTEDEGLFHIDYGNVFIADLGQLESRALDQWVSLKFTITDAAGNTQIQTLDNVFYAGQMISVHELTTENLLHQVYPNPFTNEVRITTAQAVNGTANIQVYNVLGEQVYNKTENCADTKELTIDGSALKPGIYFYRINTKNDMMQGKIVKD